MGSDIETPTKCLDRVRKWLDYGDKEKWMKEMKTGLSMTASIIATMTFQLATNPPGGVIQASPKDIGDIVDINNRIICSSKLTDMHSSNHTICPGLAVNAFIHKTNYLAFLVCNTISFIASLTVCLLLVSGIPLKYRSVIWVLSIGMGITITSLALTYMFAASMVTPNSIWPSVVDNPFGIVLVVWVSMAAIINTIQFVIIDIQRKPQNN